MRIMQTLLYSLLVMTLAVSLSAQDDTTETGWNTSMVTDLTVTQTSYSDSWVGGEAGSANWVWNLNGGAERQFSPKLNFKSTLRLQFGQTHTQTITETLSTTGDLITEKNWQKPKKSTDLIDWENVARFTLGKIVDPYAAVRVETQFYNGGNPDKKLFFSPLKITESGGVAHQFHKTKTESVVSRLGFAIRQTTTKVADSLLSVSSSTATDGGFESVTDATLQLSERIQYVGKLTLYKALFSSLSDDETVIEEERDYWKAADVNFENTLTAAVSKIISVSLYTQVLYDKEVEKKARFKETLALGFVLRLI